MKKIALIAALMSAVSVPAVAGSVDAGVSPQQQAVAQQACADRGKALTGASINDSGSLVVTCGRATDRVSSQGVAGGLTLTTGLVAGLGVLTLLAVSNGNDSTTTTTTN